MAVLLGRGIPMDEVEHKIIRCFAEVFGGEIFLENPESLGGTYEAGLAEAQTSRCRSSGQNARSSPPPRPAHGLRGGPLSKSGECFGQGTATFLILGTPVPAVAPSAPSRPRSVPRRRSRRTGTDRPGFRGTRTAPRGRHFRYPRRPRRRRGGALRRNGSGPSANQPGNRRGNPHPRFPGSVESLRTVVKSTPQILNHNLETVPRLYPEVRPQADYGRSLLLLKRVKDLKPEMPTKSGLMLGLARSRRKSSGSWRTCGKFPATS